MKINNLIGISGRIKSGKDLVGDMLMYIGGGLTSEPTYNGFIENEKYKNHKYSVEKVTTYEIKKYADKLKDCLCIILGCTREQLEDRDYKETELGEEWDRYKLDSIYIPETMDSENSEFYTYTKYFSNLEDARDYGEIREKDFSVPEDLRKYGMSSEWSYDIEKESLTPRLLLQLLGTECGRELIHPNIWVNSMFTDYKCTYFGACDPYELDSKVQIFTNSSKWIVTDVRFPQNEGKAITDRGGLMIGIRRKFALRFPEYAHLKARGPYEIPKPLYSLDTELYRTLTHESDELMGDHSWCDVVIENNGTVEELFNNILKVVK
jgi:hypothetical protein